MMKLMVNSALCLLLIALQQQGTFGESIGKSQEEGSAGLKVPEQNDTFFNKMWMAEAPSAASSFMMQIALLVLVGVASYAYFGEKSESRKREIATEGDSQLLGKAAFLGIGTANPPYRWKQEQLFEGLEWKSKDEPGYVDDDFVPFMKRMFEKSGVQYRWGGEKPTPLGHLANGGRPNGILGTHKGIPGVTLRQAYWAKWAPKLSVEAAEKAVQNWGGNRKDITHVIFHSCTGFKAPGVELDIVDGLKLTGVRRRLGINFMGCFGGFTGMALAKTFCEADPTSIVLLVCCELCSPHASISPNRSKSIGNSFFGEGCGAAVIGPGRHGDWVIDRQVTKTLGTNTRHMMTWEPTDHGYEMFLDKSIGKNFGMHLLWNLKSYLKGICSENFREVEWCCHPGGKAILDFFCSKMLGLGIEKQMLHRSYEILRLYGNMSSATIFFVLADLLKCTEENPTETKSTAVCLGFGPGLTLELATLQRIGSEADGVAQNDAVGAALEAVAECAATSSTSEDDIPTPTEVTTITEVPTPSEVRSEILPATPLPSEKVSPLCTLSPASTDDDSDSAASIDSPMPAVGEIAA